MLDTTTEDKLAAILDRFFDEQYEFEKITRSIPLSPEQIKQLGRDIARSSQVHAARIVDLAGEDPARWGWAKALLRKHPLHKEFLLQSGVLVRAQKKPTGEAGDRQLMQMLQRNGDVGNTLYAKLKNQVYQSLPVAQAMRERTRGIQRLLASLPEGARVLAPACGLAWEIRQLPRNGGLPFQIDLMDKDRLSLERSASHLSCGGATHVPGSAEDIARGVTSFARLGDTPDTFQLKASTYDLVYTAGLYDHISTEPSKAGPDFAGLMAQMFDLVKPGGKLIVGNFLRPGGRNPHRISHQFMMEAFADWKLHYRTGDALRALADPISADIRKATLLDETLARPLGPESIIGFLILEKRA